MLSDAVVLAVDGGNSKTDLALVRADGALLALARGPLSSPHHIGLDGASRVLEGLLAEAAAAAGLPAATPSRGRPALLAGADLPAEEGALHERVAARGWARALDGRATTRSRSCARAPSAAGASRSCAAPASTASASRPTAATSRFPALGAITGDWGGGYDVGLAALVAAARERGRARAGDPLERVVPAHFGLAHADELAEAIHARQHPAAPAARARAAWSSRRRRATRSRPGSSTASPPRSSRSRASRSTRLELDREPVEVLLGGGLLRAGDGRLRGAIAAGLARGRARHPGAARARRRSWARRCSGSIAWRRRRAQARIRRELAAAVERHGELSTLGSRRWLRCASSRRRSSTPAATGRRSTRSSWRSPTAS